jgi:hypothetical protein
MACHAFAQGDAHPANLAKKGALAGDFLNDGGLAKTHFAEALTEFGGPFQCTDATGRPGGKLGEGHAWTLKARIKVH